MIDEKTIDNTYKSFNRDAESAGYHLNPDVDFTKDLIKGLLVNEKRYGYWSCPCRLASGEKSQDIDIICPCDYRDPDLNEYGMCYCGLYVSQSILEGKEEIKPIPERRPTIKERKKLRSDFQNAWESLMAKEHRADKKIIHILWEIFKKPQEIHIALVDLLRNRDHENQIIDRVKGVRSFYSELENMPLSKVSIKLLTSTFPINPDDKIWNLYKKISNKVFTQLEQYRIP